MSVLSKIRLMVINLCTAYFKRRITMPILELFGIIPELAILLKRLYFPELLF
jgi:hypothetical protein